MGMFMGTVFFTYAYSFYMGSIWIENKIYNQTFKREYRSGEILSCFFGVVFGMFCIGFATPNIKAVAEGKVAGKMAFDVIEREPNIK